MHPLKTVITHRKQPSPLFKHVKAPSLTFHLCPDKHTGKYTLPENRRQPQTIQTVKEGKKTTEASDELIRSVEMFTSSPTLGLKETYLIITALITAGTITQIGCEETATKIGLELPLVSSGFTVSASISDMKERCKSARLLCCEGKTRVRAPCAFSS